MQVASGGHQQDPAKHGAVSGRSIFSNACAHVYFVSSSWIVPSSDSFSHWLEWSPPASPALFGLQGRYLLPLAPDVLLAPPSFAAGRRWCPDRVVAAAVAVLTVAGNLAGLSALARHDWAG
ncbi:MAG: hypothetical protein FJ148_15350 [Deltaproteobacteria bacterium]|nr:hypothetical protein [Deltaproteobacteria bacterium]